MSFQPTFQLTPSLTGGGSGGPTKKTLDVLSGEAINAQDAVYLDTSSGEVHQATVDNVTGFSNHSFLGVSEDNAGGPGVAVSVIYEGPTSVSLSGPTGHPVYVSETSSGTLTLEHTSVEVGTLDKNGKVVIGQESDQDVVGSPTSRRSTFTAGAAISKNDPVFYDNASQTVKPATADEVRSQKAHTFVGIATESVSGGDPVLVSHEGDTTLRLSGASKGQTVYLQQSSVGVTTTRTDTAIGHADENGLVRLAEDVWESNNVLYISSLDELPSPSGSGDLAALDRGGGETAELKDDANAGDWVLRGGTNDWTRIEDWSSGGLDQWTIQTNTWDNISVSNNKLIASHDLGDDETLKINLNVLVPVHTQIRIGFDLGGSSTGVNSNERCFVKTMLLSDSTSAYVNAEAILTQFGGDQYKYEVRKDGGSDVNNGTNPSYSTSDVLTSSLTHTIFDNGDCYAEARLFNADGSLNVRNSTFKDLSDFVSPVSASYWRPSLEIINPRTDEAKDFSIHYVDLRF